MLFCGRFFTLRLQNIRPPQPSVVAALMIIFIITFYLCTERSSEQNPSERARALGLMSGEGDR